MKKNIRTQLKRRNTRKTTQTQETDWTDETTCSTIVKSLYVDRAMRCSKSWLLCYISQMVSDLLLQGSYCRKNQMQHVKYSSRNMKGALWELLGNSNVFCFSGGVTVRVGHEITPWLWHLRWTLHPHWTWHYVNYSLTGNSFEKCAYSNFKPVDGQTNNWTRLTALSFIKDIFCESPACFFLHGPIEITTYVGSGGTFLSVTTTTTH